MSTGRVDRTLDREARADGGPGRRGILDRNLPGPNRRAGGASVELVVHLADTQIPTRDLHNLRVGDIIATDQFVGAPLAVTIQGRTAFHAHPGAAEGRKAVRIEERTAHAAENQAAD